MHFYVPLKGNAFWELTEGEILERQKKNSQLLSCRFVGENPAGLTFRCQLEKATPISHFHFKKPNPFFSKCFILMFCPTKMIDSIRIYLSFIYVLLYEILTCLYMFMSFINYQTEVVNASRKYTFCVL